MVYIYLFFGFSAFGWLVDSLYRSLAAGELTRGSYPFLFSPEYGAAGLVVFYIFSVNISPVFHIILSWLSVIVIEYIFGSIYLAVFKKRFWDYQDNFLNLNGHIDLLHSSYWLLLVLAGHYLVPDALIKSIF